MSFRPTVLILTLGLLTVSPPAEGQQSIPDRCERSQGTSAYPIQPTPGYNHDRFGTEPRDLFREFGAFVASFDSEDDDDGDQVADLLGLPEWVAYEMKNYKQDASGQFEAPFGGVKRPNPWYRHNDLAFMWNQPGVTKRGLDHSYRGSGFNRGHLAMRAHANRIGWRQGCNTHFFFNAVPQRPNFNQGIWLDLEYWTGAWANKYGAVWIITGPIVDRSQPIETIGDANEAKVAVPHALFKIVARDDPDSFAPRVLAFIYPQQDPSYGGTTCTGNYPHDKFLVSIREIEEATGLKFFENLNLTAEQREAFEKGRAPGLWPAENRFFGLSC